MARPFAFSLEFQNTQFVRKCVFDRNNYLDKLDEGKILLLTILRSTTNHWKQLNVVTERKEVCRAGDNFRRRNDNSSTTSFRCLSSPCPVTSMSSGEGQK